MKFIVIRLLFIYLTSSVTKGQNLDNLDPFRDTVHKVFQFVNDRDTVQKVFEFVNEKELYNLQFGNFFKDYFKGRFFGEIERERYFAYQAGLKPNISSECVKSLREYYDAFQEGRIWALKMVDSFGKLPNGLLDGTMQSYGDYDMCTEIILPDKFQGRYCLIKIQTGMKIKRSKYTDFSMFNVDITKTLKDLASVDSPDAQPYGVAAIITSICLPSSCSSEEVPHLLSKILNLAKSGLEVSFSECSVQSTYHFTLYEIITIAIMLSVILFEVTATVIDMRLRSQYPDGTHQPVVSTTLKGILCFSMYTNTIRLFKKEENPDSIKIFHGMKVICMSWIILGHTIIFSLQSLGRYKHAVEIASGFFFQIVINPFVAVETFFFIGGFLVIYSYMKTSMPHINIFFYAMYRYLRLMPQVLFVMALAVLTSNMASGPRWQNLVVDYVVGTCRTTWWKTLFGINNVSGIRNSCLPWTWYIAVDVQLYMGAYFLLLILKKNPRKALNIIKLLIVLDVALIAASHYYYDLPPVTSLITIPFDVGHIYTEIMHTRAYNHLVPYCFGLLVGYVISTKRKFNLTKRRKLLGWTISLLFSSLAIFPSYIWNSGHNATILESVLYGSSFRLLWSIMLSWITYVCLNGDGGVLTSILSWEVFVPFARVTYMAYLIHPLIMQLKIGSARQIFVSDRSTFFLCFLGFLVVSYAMAFVFCVMFESPFLGILNTLIRSKTGKDEKLKKSYSLSA